MAVHLPVVDNRSSIRNDGSRNYVHPADVHGRFTRARNAVFAALIAVYAIIPWVRINGRPAVQIDIEHRRFFLFGSTFNAQDIWMMFFLLTGVGFALVSLTAVAGRVWCGWACPQTVFLEGVFRKIERLIQGSREKRLRRNAGPFTFDTFWRKALTHALYLLGSLLLAHVFLSYFVSLPELFRMVRANPAAHPEAFAWAVGITAVLYFNFSWFREQTCVVLCPYGRLQSVLIDDDSLVIGYDVARGEPRGKARAKAEGTAGDCVDCNRCVVVCPTGIDIRNGLQMDCVACTACIDACDEVMDKLHRPRGLIRYDSLHGLRGEARKFVRPRLGIYAVLGLLGLLVATFALRRHMDFEANVLRLPGDPYVVEDGVVRNAFQIHLVNKSGGRETFDVTPRARPETTFVMPMREVTLGAMAGTELPVFITLPARAFHGDFQAEIAVHRRGAPASETIVVRAPFIGPSAP